LARHQREPHTNHLYPAEIRETPMKQIQFSLVTPRALTSAPGTASPKRVPGAWALCMESRRVLLRSRQSWAGSGPGRFCVSRGRAGTSMYGRPCGSVAGPQMALDKAMGEAVRDAVAAGRGWADVGHALDLPAPRCSGASTLLVFGVPAALVLRIEPATPSTAKQGFCYVQIEPVATRVGNRPALSCAEAPPDRQWAQTVHGLASVVLIPRPAGR
jgi:hypothetical protein